MVPPARSVPDVAFAIRERAQHAEDVTAWLRPIAATILLLSLFFLPAQLAARPEWIATLAVVAVAYSFGSLLIRPHRRWPRAAGIVLTALDGGFILGGILLTGGILSPYVLLPFLGVALASFRFGTVGVGVASAGYAMIPVVAAAQAGFSPAAIAHLSVALPGICMLGAFLAFVSHRLLPAQGATHAREERFHLAVEGSNDGIWDWTIETGEVYFSPRAKEIIGYAPEEFPDSWDAWTVAVHPDDRRRILDQVRRHLRDREPLNEMEYRLRHKDGSWRWVLSRGTSARGPDGRAVRLAGSITDVTARKAAEAKLVELKQLHEDMVENVPAGVVYLDRTGRITYENRFLLGVLGARPDEEPRGWLSNILELDTVRTRPEFAQRVRHLLAGAAFHDYEFEYRSLYGKDLVLSVSGVPVDHRESGVPGGAILLVRDVTEARRAEEARRVASQRLQDIERLEEMNRFKTQLLNTASHELNTPLTPLRLQTHLLRSGALGELNERQRKSVAILDRNLGRLSALVGDVLDVARIQAGRLKLRPETIDLATLVAHAVETFEEPALARGIALEVAASEPLAVRADPARLTQVLFNLVSNAMRFTPEGGRIEVRALAEGAVARVDVADTGIGLEKRQIDALFQPFSQVHEDSRGGTGLGLYISRGILAEHGGAIACESDGPGHGTTFSLRLPLLSGFEHDASSMPSVALASRPPK